MAVLRFDRTSNEIHPAFCSSSPLEDVFLGAQVDEPAVHVFLVVQNRAIRIEYSV